MRAGQVLLNLDTEDWGEIFIGCAGGGDSMISLPVTYEAAPGGTLKQYELKISGAHATLPFMTYPSGNHARCIGMSD